jgi:hypothetical protein
MKEREEGRISLEWMLAFALNTLERSNFTVISFEPSVPLIHNPTDAGANQTLQ